MLEDVWDVEKRPEKYRDEEYVNAIPMETLRHLIAINQSENSSKPADNFEILVKDRKPKPVSFKAATDDGEKMLHPARYLRLPTAKHDEWYFKMPQERRETYISMDLDFCGADDKVADATISNLHNRKKPLMLKHFLSQNVAVASRPKKEIRKLEQEGITNTTDWNWFTPGDLSEVQEAIMNFASVNHYIWPLDCTGLSMLRLLTKYKWVSNCKNYKLRTEIITSFFNKIMRDNAVAAVNNSCIVSYKQMEKKLHDILSANGISTEVPRNDFNADNMGKPSFNTQAAGKPQGKPPFQGKQNFPAQANSAQPGKNFASLGGFGCCYGWNDTKGGNCSNPQEVHPTFGNGCRKGNVFFLHRCNKKTDGKSCLKEHRRINH